MRQVQQTCCGWKGCRESQKAALNAAFHNRYTRFAVTHYLNTAAHGRATGDKSKANSVFVAAVAVDLTSYFTSGSARGVNVYIG